MECLDNESLCRRLTLTKLEARVHVVAMNQISSTVCVHCVACLAPLLLCTQYIRALRLLACAFVILNANLESVYQSFISVHSLVVEYEAALTNYKTFRTVLMFHCAI